MFLTPETIDRLVNHPRFKTYKLGHELNADHPAITGCKLGAVFSWRGEDYVYVGLDTHSKRFPIIGVNAGTRKGMKFAPQVLEKVRKGV